MKLLNVCLLLFIVSMSVFFGCTSETKKLDVYEEMHALFPEIERKIFSMGEEKVVIVFKENITWVFADSLLMIYDIEDHKNLVGSIDLKRENKENKINVLKPTKILPFLIDFVGDKDKPYKKDANGAWSYQKFAGSSQFLQGVILESSIDCDCFPLGHRARKDHPWLNGKKTKTQTKSLDEAEE